MSVPIGGQAGIVGDADGVGNSAIFHSPSGVAVDSAGNVYVADTGNSIMRKITPAAVVSTIAGIPGVSGYGFSDGPGASARFTGPQGVAVDSSGNLYVADTDNHAIRKITPVGTNWLISTIAGSTNQGFADGMGTNAQFLYPSGITADSVGNVYVADTYNNSIRKITPIGTNWLVSTIAGSTNGNAGFGFADGTGINALFNHPNALIMDNLGNLFVADTGNQCIRLIQPIGSNWLVSTIGGSPSYQGSADGSGGAALFANPAGIVVDNTGNLYVADTGNNTIKRGGYAIHPRQSSTCHPHPANNATLVVTLLPPQANGQWRFPWELTWRQSGTAATNLVPNQNYTVEFSPVPGYVAIPAVLGDQLCCRRDDELCHRPVLSHHHLGGHECRWSPRSPLPGQPAQWGRLEAFGRHQRFPSLPALPPTSCQVAISSSSRRSPTLSKSRSSLSKSPPESPTVVQEVYQPSQPAPTGFSPARAGSFRRDQPVSKRLSLRLQWTTGNRCRLRQRGGGAGERGADGGAPGFQ